MSDDNVVEERTNTSVTQTRLVGSTSSSSKSCILMKGVSNAAQDGVDVPSLMSFSATISSSREAMATERSRCGWKDKVEAREDCRVSRENWPSAAGQSQHSHTSLDRNLIRPPIRA